MIVMKKYAITQLKKGKILMLRYGEKFTITDELMEVVATYMDDGSREKLHNELAPCSNETFLKKYCEVDSSFEKLLYDEFGIELEDTELDYIIEIEKFAKEKLIEVFGKENYE